MTIEERRRRRAALEEEETELLDRYLASEDPQEIERIHDELAAIQCSMMALQQQRLSHAG